jgi:hypothetical protein
VGYGGRSPHGEVTWFEVTERGVAGLKATPMGNIARRRTKHLITSLTTSERDGFVKIADAFVDAMALAVADEGDRITDVPGAS